MKRSVVCLLATVMAVALSACAPVEESSLPRASGYVEATEVRVASRVPGRVAEVRVDEGATVQSGDVLVVLSTRETELALRHAGAARDQALAEQRLLEAGTRPEDVRQAEAQLSTARAEQAANETDLRAARADEARFAQLVRNRAGTEKQRDDAAARRELAEARLAVAGNRVAAAAAALDQVRAGARPQQLDAARARVASADAQIAVLENDRDEATVLAPTSGVVATRLIEPGELLSPGQPMLVLIDLDHAWANTFVEEPMIPQLRLDGPATVLTDAGDRLAGRITFVSPQAEFTPRNVQTAEERAKLVYRVKVTVDNREGLLKPGMPVVVEFATGG